MDQSRLLQSAGPHGTGTPPHLMITTKMCSLCADQMQQITLVSWHYIGQRIIKWKRPFSFQPFFPLSPLWNITSWSSCVNVFTWYWICFTPFVELHVAGGQVGDVRLFGHTTNGRGAVEILTTQGWSGICPDSSWGGTDARIICQSLGYDFGFEETLEYVTDHIFLFNPSS